MSKSLMWLALLIDGLMFAICLYYEEWFFSQILLITQIILAIACLAHHRQRGVENSDNLKVESVVPYIFATALAVAPIFWATYEWAPVSNWARASHEVTHKFEDVTALLGIVIASLTVAGSVVLQRRER